MHRTVFGNLAEWDRVLERLAELLRTGDLQRHQDDLLILLRYPGNWRLREAALEAIPAIQQPAEALLQEACRIMRDEGLYFQVRVLAAEAIHAALDRLPMDSPDETIRLRREIREHVQALLHSQDVPVLHQAARRILPKVE